VNFLLLSAIKTGVFAAILLTTLAYLQLVERKVLGHIQLRPGPYRVGPHGILQPLADVIKLFTKEDLIPPMADRFFFVLAPFLAVSLSLIPVVVMPFGPEVRIFGIDTRLQLTDLNVGVLFVLAVSSLSVYSIALAGWSSNNKYALLGGLRAAAQMISYELPLGLTVASVLLVTNSMSLHDIVMNQAGYYFGFIPRWHIIQMPGPQLLGFILFLISGFAETNRIPFDLPEAENELVAGFHTEYSSMKFASFFMAEYANIITVTSMATLLFLGGWHPLFPAAMGSNFVPALVFLSTGLITLYHGLNPARPRDRYSLPVFAMAFFTLAAAFLVPTVQSILMPIFWFGIKTAVLLFVFIWVRGTSPRFRYDQLMGFTWKFLFPVAMLNMLVTALLVALYGK
jgi:NADH-quinone oxidoreductase subunit H